VNQTGPSSTITYVPDAQCAPSVIADRGWWGPKGTACGPTKETREGAQHPDRDARG